MDDARIEPVIRPPEARLRAWSEIALLAQVGMEMVWAALWYTGMFESQVRTPWWVVWLVLWGLVAGTFALARLLEATHAPMRLRQAIFLAWIVIYALLSLKIILFSGLRTDLVYLVLAPIRSLSGADTNILPFLHIFLVPILVLRGVALATALPDVRSALLDFQLGLMALLLHGLLYLPGHPGLSSAGLFLFLFLGLLTMSAARIAGVTNFRGGRLARLSPTWVAGILAGALVVVAVGLLLGRLASGGAGELISRVFLLILGLLGLLIVVVLFPLINLIAALIGFIMQRLAGRFPVDMLEGLQKSLMGLQGLAVQFLEQVRPTLHLMRIFIPLIGLGVVVALVLLWLRLRALDLKADPETDTAGLPPGSLLGLLRRLARRMRAGAPRAASPARLIAAARIRRVYADLLTLCDRLGAPRAISLTPLEFLPHAGLLFPERGDDLALITRAYVQVRYGEYPESREEVAQVISAWRLVKKDGARMLKRRR
jgi:hypothetical protein